MKRVFDICFSVSGLMVMSPLLLLLALLVRLSSRGPTLYWSDRVGRNNELFRMPKFRSMSIDTPAMATDLLSNPEQWLTPIGLLLRKTSLDELPQFWSILVGHMSFVGPRPALFNQDDLIRLRAEAGVDTLLPGLTGWAQVQGRDNLRLAEKVELDIEYLKKRSTTFDLYILWQTFWKVLSRNGVAH